MDKPQLYLPLALSILAGAVFAQTPLAAAKSYEPSITVVSDDMIYDVHADGTFTYEETEAVRINDVRGVQQRSQLALRYSATLQELEILEAYTTTKDGRRIDVRADSIHEQQSPQSAGAPMFDDIKVKTIVFPSTEVGAVLSAHFRRTQKTPLFPGAFSMSQVFARSFDIKAAQLTLRAPATTKMYVESVNLEGGRSVSADATVQEWKWSVRNAIAEAPEAASTSAFDTSPRVSATTFPDYAAAARAYSSRAAPQAQVTPVIRTLADEITSGISDRRAQAAALYQWVSKNIRYVGIFLGTGGVVPHPADQVIQMRYGDCKDHVTVLEALFAAKGIRSSAVLVNIGDVYSIPGVATTPGVFNHAITYLPEFDLFVDSTAGVAPFGVLPLQERGKPALITDSGNGEAKVVTLPLASPKTDSVRVETVLEVDEQGTVEGKSFVYNEGVFDILGRGIFAGLPKGAEAQLASRLLTLTGQSGTGSYSHGDERDLSRPFAYSTRFTLPSLAQLPGPGALSVPNGLGALGGIYSAFETFSLPTRNSPFLIVGSHREEKTTMRLPASIRVSMLPKRLSLSNGFGRYESTYSIDGATVLITRTLDLNAPTAVVQPAEYQKLRAMGAAVARDLRAQIVYE